MKELCLFSFYCQENLNKILKLTKFCKMLFLCPPVPLINYALEKDKKNSSIFLNVFKRFNKFIGSQIYLSLAQHRITYNTVYPNVYILSNL